MMNSKDPQPPVSVGISCFLIVFNIVFVHYVLLCYVTLTATSMRIDVGLGQFQLNQGEHEVWQENGDIFAFDESLAFDVKGFTGLTVENSANTLWMSMLGG